MNTATYSFNDVRVAFMLGFLFSCAGVGVVIGIGVPWAMARLAKLRKEFKR